MKNNPIETGIVHLEDLLESEVCLALKRSVMKKVLVLLYGLSNFNWADLSRRLGYKNPEKIRHLRRKGVINLKILKGISDFLLSNGYNLYSMYYFEKNLLFIKSRRGGAGCIFNPKFPINFNSKYGAILISAMFHDGGITVRDIEPFYSNIVLEMRLRFFDAVRKVFGNLNIISVKKFNRKEVCLPKICGIIFTVVGLVPGKRTINNPHFPYFVFNASDGFIYSFLSWTIADEGHIYCPKKGFGYLDFNFTIDLTKYTESFIEKIRMEKLISYLPTPLIGNKQLLEKIDVRVEGPYFKKEWHYYKNNKLFRITQEWRICVRDWRGLNFLSKKLDIPLQYKQKALLELVKNERKVIRCDPKILRATKTFKKYFTINDISRFTSIRYGTVRRQFNYFCEDGFMNRFNRLRSNRMGAKFGYILTEKGKRELELVL